MASFLKKHPRVGSTIFAGVFFIHWHVVSDAADAKFTAKKKHNKKKAVIKWILRIEELCLHSSSSSSSSGWRPRSLQDVSTCSKDESCRGISRYLTRFFYVCVSVWVCVCVCACVYVQTSGSFSPLVWSSLFLFSQNRLQHLISPPPSNAEKGSMDSFSDVSSFIISFTPPFHSQFFFISSSVCLTIRFRLVYRFIESECD